MPIVISDKLPAAKALLDENIFVLHEGRAVKQDIRPLEIIIYNIMPDKISTETQLLRLLGNTPIQIQITLVHPKLHESKNTSAAHLDSFYTHFDDIKGKKFDGLLITGAPVEHLDFEDVDYWDELKRVMDWSLHNVTSTFYICWAAYAGLYHFYGVQKQQLEEKLFGVFLHSVSKKHVKLLRGFDDAFFVPHSRHTKIKKEDLLRIPEIEILSESKEAGVCLLGSRDGRQFFVTGHFEYDAGTLKKEYERDVSNGLKISVPKNYFLNNDPKLEPLVNWRAHAHLLFSNWLNYCVYQETPFDLKKIG